MDDKEGETEKTHINVDKEKYCHQFIEIILLKCK